MKKSAVIAALNEFPSEFELEEFFEKLIVIEKINEGLKDIDEGNIVDHEAVKKLINEWQK